MSQWKKKIGLFVFDLDGTALGGYEPYARLPDRFSAFLDELDGHGVKWGTNSTWHPLLQAEMISSSAVRSRAAFLCGRTGLMRAIPSKDGLLRQDAEWDLRASAIEADFPRRIAPIMEKLDEFGDLESFSDEPLIVRIHVHADSLDVAGAFFRNFGATHPGVQILSKDGGRVFTVQPAEMSKGVALAELQAALNIPPERTLVAGDGENDLPMMHPALAGFAVCFANACDAVLANVQRPGGSVGTAMFSDGVIEAARTLLESP